MPELPEVETARRLIADEALGRRIADVDDSDTFAMRRPGHRGRRTAAPRRTTAQGRVGPVHADLRRRRRPGAVRQAAPGPGPAEPRYRRARTGRGRGHPGGIPQPDHQGSGGGQGPAARPVQDRRRGEPAGRRDPVAGQGLPGGADGPAAAARTRTASTGRWYPPWSPPSPAAACTPATSSRPAIRAAPARGAAPRCATARWAGAPPGGARASRRARACPVRYKDLQAERRQVRARR